jgi:hypothetical protein
MVGTPTQRASARPAGFAHPTISVTNPIEFSSFQSKIEELIFNFFEMTGDQNHASGLG